MGAAPVSCNTPDACCADGSLCKENKYAVKDVMSEYDFTSDEAIRRPVQLPAVNWTVRPGSSQDLKLYSAPSIQIEEEYHEFGIFITKDKSRSTKLGIDVDYVQSSVFLRVRKVTGGLVGEWNAANPLEMVCENDLIVEVNRECKAADLIMRKLRNDAALEITLRRFGEPRAAVCNLGPRISLSGSRASSASQQVRGNVRLLQINPTVCRIEYEIHGLAPGKHGFHIHEKADFSDGCASAGPQYDPSGLKVRNGNSHAEIRKRHAGDLGNVEADENGVARGVINDFYVKLEGEFSVVGRSIIVHADPDDLSSSNVGLACGEIILDT